MAENNNEKKGSRPPSKMMLSRALVLLAVCGIAAFSVLIARLYDIQITNHERYESAAIDQQVRKTVVTASRGTIYDRNMKILAMSASVDTIYISPAEIKMYDEDPVLIARSLSEILDVDYGKILEMTGDTKSWYKTVRSKVEEDVAARVREFKNENNLKGVKIESDTKRYYPYGSLACHVVGFVGFENSGLSGIEAKLDSVLTGVSGRIVRAKNSYGTDMLYTKYEDYYDSEDGNDVVLTLDSTIQYYVEKHLKQAVEDYEVENGAAAIAMNPKTGEILAMASLGDFDLNAYQDVSDEVKELINNTPDQQEKNDILSQAQQRQWRNKAVSDTYEPGSTFKIITLATALEEGVTDLDSSYYCGGYIEVTGDSAGKGRKCWKTGGHGSQTLTQAVQHSCNVAFINLGLSIGAETFYKYARAFGFFDTTGIELSGEAGSLWWSDELFCNPQNKTQLAAASFGQTFNISPMQLITAVSACVNGGYLMQPYLVREIRADDGTVISKTEPTVVRQVISEETSKTVCRILEQVVCDKVDGTGKNAYVAGYRIGGKTGTSTDTVREAEDNVKKYIVSFLGFAPTDDPQIAVLVLLDNPRSQTVYVSGGNMGAPTVGNIMADVLPYLGVEAVYSDEEAENMDRSVPQVTGMSLDEAKGQLAAQGLSYRVIGDGGTVTMQLPSVNTVVAAKSEILLYAGSEPSESLEEMPDLTGLTYSVARQRLGYYGLFIKNTGNKMDDSQFVVVSRQSIAPRTEVKHGTVVEVTLVDMDSSVYGQY